MSQIIRFLICLFLFNAFSHGIFAKEEVDKKTPSVLTADHVDMDKEKGIFTARGNVIVSQKGHVLHGDVVTYNQNTDIVTASGNVRLQEPDGDIFFAQRMELTGDLREGFLRDVKGILQDGALMVAESGRRFDGAYAEFERTLYSPCQLCKGWPPTWRLRSRTSLWKEEEKDVEHTDTILEILGVPIFYTPFLTHPDPSVERRRGILWPILGGGPDLGIMIMVPYYIPFSQQNDITFRPFLGTKAQILSTQYRHYFNAGEIGLDASVGHTDIIQIEGSEEFKSRAKRWHLKGNAIFDLNDTWRVGAQIERSSDPTYIKRFPDLGIRSLSTTNGYIEGFFGKSYTKAEATYFQGSNTEDQQSIIPTILPQIEGAWVSQPGWQNSYWTAEGNFLGLSRKEGISSRRLILITGWHLPYISPLGDVYHLSATIRGDLYKLKDFTPDGEMVPIDTTEKRFFPQLHLNWRFPFYTPFIEDSSLIISPIASFTVSPNSPPEKNIPDDDTGIFEIDEGNLFSANRFNGYDTIDRGARLAYGLQFSLLGWGKNNLFIGQTYNVHRPRENLVESGLGKSFSDYILRVEIKPKPWFSVMFRGIYDKKTLRTRFGTLQATAGPKVFKIQGNYNFLTKIVDEKIVPKSEQLTLSLSSQLTDKWSISAGTRKNLGNPDQTLSQSIALSYKDDCFGLDLSLNRSFYKDQDLRPAHTFLFKFSFKHLGDFQYAYRPKREEEENSEDNTFDFLNSFT